MPDSEARSTSLPRFLQNRRALEESERRDFLDEIAALRNLTAAQRARLFFDLLEFEDRLLAAKPRDLAKILANERAEKFRAFARLRRGRKGGSPS